MKQRAIKFRAWDGKSVMFYQYPDTVTDHGSVFEIPSERDVQPHERVWYPAETVLFHPELGWKVMQFTGLRDKNGKEIYEGDRIRYTFLEVINGGVREPEPKFITVESVLRFDVMRAISDADEIEVIGNIYENPELLPTNTTEG